MSLFVSAGHLQHGRPIEGAVRGLGASIKIPRHIQHWRPTMTYALIFAACIAAALGQAFIACLLALAFVACAGHRRVQ